MTQRVDGSRLLARERFLGGDGLDASVRPEIRASWRRSQLNGVAPDRLPELDVAELDRNSRLVQAAAPVLDRMADDIAGVPMSLLLTDRGARILDRRVGVHGLRAKLDGINAVPGAAYTEDAVGTNGVGSCIETRQPFIVNGGEHFIEPLCPLTCAAAPIVHPFTGRLEGVLDVTCAADDTTGLMLAFVREAAAEIQRRLEEAASVTERALFDSFLTAIHRSGRPVLSVNGDLVIANVAAARLLAPEDHAAVWDQVGDSLAASATSSEIALVSGATYRADVVPIAVGGRPVGALVRLGDESGRDRHPGTSSGALPGLVGTTPTWRALCREAAVVARSALHAIVHGEDGSGKLAVAQAMHTLGDAASPFEVLDVGAVVGAHHEWPARLRGLAARPGTVLIRHLDLLAAEHVAAVNAICETATARIVATADGGWLASAPRRLIDRLPGRVAVPPLREHLGDLPVLVDELVRRRVDATGAVRVHREVSRVLARHRWPGNVRELEGVVLGALARRRRGDVGVGDLPPEYRAGPAPDALTPIQVLERDAICRALDAERGNKHAAAERLGISRSTLYRKLETYHLT